MRVGYGAFGASFYYNYTPLFEAGKGPEMTKMNSVTVTLYVPADKPDKSSVNALFDHW